MASLLLKSRGPANHLRVDAMSPKASPKLTHENETARFPPNRAVFFWRRPPAPPARQEPPPLGQAEIMGRQHVVDELPRRILPAVAQRMGARRLAVERQRLEGGRLQVGIEHARARGRSARPSAR